MHKYYLENKTKHIEYKSFTIGLQYWCYITYTGCGTLLGVLQHYLEVSTTGIRVFKKIK